MAFVDGQISEALQNLNINSNQKIKITNSIENELIGKRRETYRTQEYPHPNVKREIPSWEGLCLTTTITPVGGLCFLVKIDIF